MSNIPSVSSSTTSNPLKKLLGIAVAIIAALLALVTFAQYLIGANSDETEKVEEKPQEEYLTSRKTLALPELKIEEEKPAKEIIKEVFIKSDEKPEPTAMAAAPVTPMMPPVQTQPTFSFAPKMPEAPAAPSLRQLQDQAPLRGGGAAPAATPGGYVGMVTPDADAKPSEAAEKFGDKLKAVATPSTSAENLGDTSLKLLKGTFIECVLETRLDTTVTGMTSCIVPKHIYSANGKTLLIERGSRVTGEYTGAVENGLNRIFVLWSQVTTPNGIRINFNSPGTDSLGGAGLGGHVDFHWWKRFGNALMFTLVQDAFDFATSKATEQNGGVSYTTNSEDGMKDIIQEAMKQAGNIPPTLTKNQGERIGIFVARDIDFSSVYQLTPTR